MSPNHALETYLHDHLSGAAAGVEIARRLAKTYEDTPAEASFRGLAVDIEADRDTLVELLEQLGGDRSQLKEAAGWAVEKLARLKLSPLTGAADLSRLLELEALGLGITGKLALWRSLEVALAPDDLGVDLELLQRRAEAQRTLVESLRLEEARAAFVAD